MKRIYIILIVICIMMLLFLLYEVRRYILSTRRTAVLRKKLENSRRQLAKLDQDRKKLNNTRRQLDKAKKDNKINKYKTKKLLAQQKYLQYMLNEDYDEEIIDIDLSNNSDICIIMTGDEKIYPFYGSTIDLNYMYANNMGYDFKAVIGRVLDKSKYKPHFDRYKLLLNIMQNKNYKYILYIDSDAFIHDPTRRIEDFIDMMDSWDFLLGSWDCWSAVKEKRALPINSGVLLIKNCEKSIEFCRDILTLEPACYLNKCTCVGKTPIKYYDQCVIDRLKKYHNNIKLVPYGILQVFLRNIDECVGKIDVSNPSFIFHLTGMDDNIRKNHTKKFQMEQEIKNNKCSVYILNYKRPHNVKKQILALSDNPYIDEIVISNGHPDYTIINDNNNPKLVIINDFENNKKLYCARRWSGIIKCKNDYILSLDDDMIPSDELIKELFYQIIKDPMNIYGPFKRMCNKYGYSQNTDNGYNTIITPILMVSKQLISQYMNNGFNKYIDWIKKHKGNCEDLAVNMYLHSIGIEPIFIDGKYNMLDTSNGYSNKGNHMNIRNQFCKEYCYTDNK